MTILKYGTKRIIMKKALFIIMATLLLVAGGCAKPAVETIDAELAAFVGTRSDAPLEGTVWELRTGEDYNRYLLFREGEISLFYGIVEDGELQRWSDFYSAPYALGNGVIATSLSYPLWGQKEVTQTAGVIRKAGGFSLYLDGDCYEYYGPYTEDLEGMWMTITVNIAPWII